MENLKLVKGSDEWILPDDSWISGVPFTVRRKESDRACQHGTVDTGDGKVDSRTVELTIFVSEKTQAEYFTALDSIKKRLYRRDQKLYVTSSRYINLSSLYSFKEEYITGFANRRCFVTAEFKCNDPFFYSDTPIAAGFTVTESPQVFTVDNISNVDSPAVITVTAAEAVPSVQLTNTTNGRMSYYADPQLTSGAAVVFDTANATVKRDGSNTINAFSGTFIELEPGDNVFSYEGAPCVIQIAYIPRWL